MENKSQLKINCSRLITEKVVNTRTGESVFFQGHALSVLKEDGTRKLFCDHKSPIRECVKTGFQCAYVD